MSGTSTTVATGVGANVTDMSNITVAANFDSARQALSGGVVWNGTTLATSIGAGTNPKHVLYFPFQVPASLNGSFASNSISDANGNVIFRQTSSAGKSTGWAEWQVDFGGGYNGANAYPATFTLTPGTYYYSITVGGVELSSGSFTLT